MNIKTLFALIFMIILLACTQSNIEINENNLRTFKLTGGDFFFTMDGEENPTLAVKKGQTVRIELQSAGGSHDWVIEEFSASTGRIEESDGNAVIEFVADKKGEFYYYCSVGNHRENGMEGILRVES